MTEREKFDQAMRKILSVSKAEMQRRMEAERNAKASASPGPASSRRGRPSSSRTA